MTTYGFDSERFLLLAVRNVLRSERPYSDQQCEIEFDEMAPAVVGDVYVAVTPGGWRPGKNHNTQSGVIDLVFGVDVTVIKRIGAVPRDRRRDVFLNNLGALDEEIDSICRLVDWGYGATAVFTTANALILAETGTDEGFVEPLRFAGIDKRPRLAPAELFAGTGQAAGMIRTINFHGARRCTHR